MQRTLQAVRAERPDTTLRSLFDRAWPEYRRWYLRDGELARPTFLECERALRTHMPELVPIWEAIVESVGGGDLPARFLSLWRPRPFLTGCSQAAWTRDTPLLIRNYDYHPGLWDGVLLWSAWNRRVMAMSDCLWGVLDGMNDAGLAVALSFGGRRDIGVGFGLPVILRYVLEVCDDVASAVEVLRRVPSHMAYNVTLVDRERTVRTVRIGPDREAVVEDVPFATNHQHGRPVWPEYANATRTLERESHLEACLAHGHESAERFITRFLEPPLHVANFTWGWGTLYTAVYRPWADTMSLVWPGSELTRSIDAFGEAEVPLRFALP